MAYTTPELEGMAGNTSGFAPANFGDAGDDRPLGAIFDIGGHGSATPYSSAVNAIVHKHTDEIKIKMTAMLNLQSGWKKRLRDFLSTKNNDLLDFLKLPVASHPVFGRGELLLRRFGNPQVTPTHPSVRDMVMDISGEDVISHINTLLSSYETEGPLKDYAHHTRIIYEEYRTAGDEILTQQVLLKGKLEKFDRIQGRLTSLLEIDPIEEYVPLLEATEAYLKRIFDENRIEVDYKKLIQAYRRFACLRDIVSMSRNLLSQESEPICSICLNDYVAYALTPCGHTLCQTCMRRQSGQCFMCRAPIKEKVRLYFS